MSLQAADRILDSNCALWHTEAGNRYHMAKVTVYVTLKPTLLDAQGRTVEGALHNLGYEEVTNVRIGKIIELDLPQSDAQAARARAAAMCDKLLANPVTESYRIEVVE